MIHLQVTTVTYFKVVGSILHIMRTYKYTLAFGLVVWAVPFVTYLAITQLFFHYKLLFEPAFPVIVTLVTAITAYIYFQKVNWDFPHVGIKVGITWFMISIVLNLLMIFETSIKMSLLTYFIIPIITTTVGYSLEK